MALIIRLLGAGSAPMDVTTTLYGVTGTGVLGAIVNNVRLVNVSTSNATFNLYYKPNGLPAIRIQTKEQALNINKHVVIKPDLTLGPGDALQVFPSSSNLEFVVAGVEQQ
ncbi:MAG: hypothetical protein HYY24_05350 [Verrucomicrobia bacterium]|nr:hypothetical protein [Verrucomicrobiota bacterium]